MHILRYLHPPGGGPPEWARLLNERLWAREMEWCALDRNDHRAGSLFDHVRRTHAELHGLRDFQRLTPPEKEALELAALLHDVAKPETMREREGRFRFPGHAGRSEVVARRILWEEGMPFNLREAVCALIRFHERPAQLVSEPDPRKEVLRISVISRCDHLALLAEANARGRVCDDVDERVAAVRLFSSVARELGCWSRPFPFASDHSRFLYFLKEDRNPLYEAWDDTRAEAVLLVGLPGSGRRAWIAEHAPPGHEILGLDRTRREMGLAPGDPQGPVVRRTRDQAKRIMGAKDEPRSFVWNATNIGRERRARLVGLFARYRYRVRIVYLEVPPDELWRRNDERINPIPAGVLEGMLHHWEVPDPTEAQQVDWLVRP